MDICEKLRWMADKSCNELIEAANEIERLREGLKIASVAVESLHIECDRHRQSANEHRNAAMEADLRTQAAVRSEKQALAEVERLRERLAVAFATCTQLEALACDFTVTRHPSGSEDFHCGCQQMMVVVNARNFQSDKTPCDHEPDEHGTCIHCGAKQQESCDPVQIP